MSFLLKIVEGPNKGAEIALVDGLEVTLGKSDDCDIVLADQTMPDEPIAIKADESGVTVGGEPLDPFTVKTFGTTSLAVGPADAPWDELKWQKTGETGGGERETRNQENENGDARSGKRETGSADETKDEKSGDGKKDAGEPDGKKRKRGGCCGCIVVIALLLVAAAVAAWFFRREAKDFCDERGWSADWAMGKINGLVGMVWHHKTNEPAPEKKHTLEDVAEKYGLAFDGTTLSGNVATRRERLAASAEAYAARPGADLDISDDESFRSAAEDALFTFTEGAIKVVAATNRFLEVAGVSRSPSALKKTIEALNADMPRLRGIDVKKVTFRGLEGWKAVADDVANADGENADDSGDAPPSVQARKASKMPAPLPLCGILTTPYPCIIARDGRRYLEGSAIDGGVITEIGADYVTITNSTGRFTWKP